MTRHVPGYDCHGLPIELKVDRGSARKARLTTADFRQACRGYQAAIGVMTQVPAPRRVRRLGTSYDDELPLPRRRSRAREDVARARLQGQKIVFGASTAGRRWPRPRWSAAASSPSICVEFPLDPSSRPVGLPVRDRKPRRIGPHLDDDTWTIRRTSGVPSDSSTGSIRVDGS
jgi:hypothetical protein